jgi:hypothetical protein
MRWSDRPSVCELPLLTVTVPGAWHVCGTSHACRVSPLVADLGLPLPVAAVTTRSPHSPGALHLTLTWPSRG